MKLGGPTIFMNRNGKWGKYALPEGKRIENGDKIAFEELTFLAPYKEVSHPGRGASEEEYDKYVALCESGAVEMAYDPNVGFIFLVPEDPS